VDERARRLIEAASEITASGDSIFDALDEFLDGLDLQERKDSLDRVWLEPPIGLAEAQEAYPSLTDQFDVLQGDVVRTDAAYLLGSRRRLQAYVIASATCDAVVRPKPRQGTILLLPVQPRTLASFEGKNDESRQKAHDFMLGRLTSFDMTRWLYLPRLADDPPDVLFNAVSLGEVCVLDASLLVTVDRVASLSLVGWRAFNVLLRALIGRTGDEEAGFRTAVALRRAA
jgi:hypothetical protein